MVKADMERFVGTWKLVSVEIRSEKGETSDARAGRRLPPKEA